MSSNNVNRSLERGISLLNCFGHDCPELGTTQLAQQLGLHKSTVHRLASVLEREGLLRRGQDERKYRLGLRLVQLGAAVVDDLDFRREALPHMRDLAARLEEAVDLAVLHDCRVLFVEQVRSPRPVNLVSSVGLSFPAHCTANGKVLLAHGDEAQLDKLLSADLPRYTETTITDAARLRAELAIVRRQGYALDRQEHSPGICACGAPICDHRGKVVAAMTVVVPSHRFDEKEETLIAAVTATAALISARLGHSNGAD